MRTLAALALVGATLALPAHAGEAQMTRPIQAGTLNEGPVSMVAYWKEVDGGAYEVTATFAAREGKYEPIRFILVLEDGAAVGFSLPGYPAAFYRFVRNGSAVIATVEALAI